VAALTGLAAAGSVWATLDWLSKAETVSVWEEVTRPAEEMVDEP
jgi:hypothetical protein